MRADLVLEGGGVKGIGLVGAITRLDEHFGFERIAGTSVGALVGALVAAGYRGAELEAELVAFPFDEVPRFRWREPVQAAGGLWSLACDRGAWTTTVIRDHIAELLDRKGVRTFGDLRRVDVGSAMEPTHEYRLVVTATDVTCGELVYLPWDYEDHFGLVADRQSVADAVAASIAIPLYFEPVTIVDRPSRMSHVLVDGGVLSNFPIGVFDRTDGRLPRWPSIGIKIMPALPGAADELLPIPSALRIPAVRHLEALFSTALLGRDQTFMSQPGVDRRTISVDTSGTHLFEFDVSAEEKHRLLIEGRRAAERFLADWDWHRYVMECRRVPKAQVEAVHSEAVWIGVLPSGLEGTTPSTA